MRSCLRDVCLISDWRENFWALKENKCPVTVWCVLWRRHTVSRSKVFGLCLFSCFKGWGGMGNIAAPFMRDTRAWCSWWSFNFLTLVFGSLARRTPCVAWCSMYINLRAIQKLQHFFCKGTGKGTVGKSKSDDKSFGADGLGKEIRDHTYLVNCHVTSFQDGPFVSNPRVPTTFSLPLHSHRAYTLEGHTCNLRKWDKRTTTRTTP